MNSRMTTGVTEPELSGIPGDARLPNRLQPMSGEYQGGHEVNQGLPAFQRPAPSAAAAGPAAPFNGRIAPLIVQALRQILQGGQ